MNVLRNISYRVYYIWRRNLWSYQRYIFQTFLAGFAEPMLYLVAMGMGLGSYMGLINGQTYSQFLAPGLIVSAAMYGATYETTFSAMVRLKMEKVYNSILVTPVSVEDIITGEILWGVTRGVISGFIIMIVVALFGLIHLHDLIWYPLLWLASGFMFASLGMLITAYAPNFDFFTYYLELFLTPMFFFSGIFFPLDNFPKIVQDIGQFLPLTHAVAISRAFASGHITLALIGNFAALLIPGFICFVWSLNKMRQKLVI